VSESSKAIRDFIRANQKSDGALDALDALRTIEDELLGARSDKEREESYSRSIVQAQAEVNAAFKDKAAGNYKVAETEQLLVLCREVMLSHKLALEVGSSEIILVQNQPFLRIHFGLRHESGFVRTMPREFPISAKAGAPDVAVRQASTSALGYFLRDAFALPRLKDEGEAAQAQAARSGPRRAATFAQEPRKPPAESNVSQKAAAVLAGIHSVRDELALERAEGKVADLRAALDGDAPPYSRDEVAAFESACRERRNELTGATP